MRSLSLLLFVFSAYAASFEARAQMVVPTQPDGATVISAIDGACLGCQIGDEENVISGDLDAHATLSVLAGLDAGASLSVTFPSTIAKGAKVGFRIDQPGLLDLSVLEGITVTTYLNGVERVSSTSGAPVTLVLLSDGTARVMMNARKSFDEVRIHVGSLLALSREINVYHAFAIPKRVSSTLVEIPTVASGATVDAEAGGLLCVPIVAPCTVLNEENVVSAAHDDAATISLPLGVGAAARVDVFLDEDKAGNPKAGFVIENGSGLLDVQLLSALTVATYRDGSLQQSATGSQLDIKPLDGDKIFVYFRARQLFDQIRLSTVALASVGVQIDVYHARLQYRVEGRVAATEAPAPGDASLRASEDSPLALAAPVPNPTVGPARLALTSTSAQHVRVRVFDMAGREVAAPFAGQVSPGESVEVAVDGRALPSGLYLVRAEGDGTLATQRLTIVR